MSYQSIILLIIAAINLCLAIAVYLRNRQNPANFYYSMMVFVGTLWILGLFGYSLNQYNPEFRLFFYQMLYVCTLITSFYYFIFTYNFPYKTFKLNKFFINSLYIIVLAYSYVLSVDSNYLISSSIFITNKENINFSNYLTFSLVFSCFIIAGFIILWLKYLKAEGVIKKQIKYILLATVATYVLASATNLFTGFWDNNYYIYIWGPIFSLINVSVIAWVLFSKK